jgi:hypothetical protein
MYTRNTAEALTGKKQFSLFTGWQLANNALYMYRHIQIDTSRLPSPRSRELDQLCRRFYNHTSQDFDLFLLEHDGNFFIQYSDSPLKQYFSSNYNPKDQYDNVVAWGKSAIVFGEYGEWLIIHHPVSFIRYFMLLNSKNYFFPPLEKLEVYNLGNDEVGWIAQDWFDYKTPMITSFSKNMQGKLLTIFPFVFCFLNILFIGSIGWLLFNRKSIPITRELKSTLLVTGCLLMANFFFCIFATIIVMRYQFFPMIVTLLFSILLFEVLEKKTKVENEHKVIIQEDSGNLRISKV